MSDPRTLADLAGESRALTGHATLLLDGHPALHLVTKGALAVFAVRREAGKVVGRRRLLFRAARGQALLSLPVPEGIDHALLAVPLEDSEVREVPLDAAAAAADFPAAAENWTALLSDALRSRTAPRAVTPSGAGRTALEAGRALRAEGGETLWIEVEEGRVRLLGDGGPELGPGSGTMPLGSAMWVTALTPALLRRIEAKDVPDLAEALALLTRRVLAELGKIAAEEAGAERERLRLRTRQGAERTAQALGEIARVMDPAQEAATEGPPLLQAMRAVGRELGVTVQPPPASDDPGRMADPLEAIARASRIRHRRVLLTGEWWKRDCGPLVARSADEERRPLALVRPRGARYVILDPATDERTPVNRETARGLHPEAVSFYRPLPPGPLGLRDLLRFALVGRGRDLAYLGLVGLFATLLGMLTPIGTGVLMDSALPDANVRLLFELGLALGAAAFGRALFLLAQGLVSVRIGIDSEARLQSAMWDRLLSLTPSFFRRFSSGDLHARVTAATEVGRDLSAATLRTLFTSALALLNLGLLFVYSPHLALIALAVTGVSLAVVSYGTVALAGRVRRLVSLQGHFHGLAVQLVGGVNKLRAAGAEGRAYTIWVRKYAKVLEQVLHVQRIQDHVGVFNVMLPTLGTVLLFWFGFGRLLGDGGTALSIGSFLAFNAAFGAFLGGSVQLSNTFLGLLDTFAKFGRAKPILEAEPEVTEALSDPGRLEGGVAISHATFRYREDGPKVIDDVSLSAAPGEFVALVGTSGSGKSTLFRLLLGFDAPESGVLLYDGQDLAGLDVLAVRRQLGVVLQAGRLNAGSLFDNIAAGNLVTLDEAMNAARDAGLADDIAQMPMGLHTMVSEGGGNLSGGQRQRVLIARALVLRPRVLLFDEATSALDNRTQEIVGRSLSSRSVTRLVIAHRLSTVRQADRIYVLDAGRIAEEGTFEELAKGGGLFARMMARQMA